VRFILVLITCLAMPATADSGLDFQDLLQEHWQRSNEEQVFFRMDADAWRFAGKLAERSGGKPFLCAPAGHSSEPPRG
jgi:hypothetical protein